MSTHEILHSEAAFSWGTADAPMHGAACFHELFARWAHQSPDMCAVVCEDQHVTYAELRWRVSRLARHLHKLGVGPDVPVGMYLERSIAVVIGLLAVARAGGAYVPLDPRAPMTRLRSIIEDAGIPVLLTEQALVDTLAVSDRQVICLDACWDWLADEAVDDASSRVSEENLAYIIYTSGSTGRPKGVGVEHRQLWRYLVAIGQRFDLQPGRHYALVSTFAADLGHTVLFPALCGGGCLHIITQERLGDPHALAEYFQRQRIDYLKIVPSHLSALLMAKDTAHLLPKQMLILGGEAASWKLIEQIRQLAPDCRITNHYGPTETTVGVLTYPVDRSAGAVTATTVPLGRALAHAQVYVLDQQLVPTAIGEVGEIYIGGDCVSRGYLHKPDLTAERFLPNPFGEVMRATRLYKTGDVARYLDDGTIVFLGRADDQVKIRGFRIELAEIDVVIREHPAVGEVIVLTYDDGVGVKRLCAYVVARADATLRPETLRHFLHERLPDYMQPTVVVLERLPLMPNGKVDRHALPIPAPGGLERDGVFVPPQTPFEKEIAAIWAGLFGFDQIGRYDNFLELGGHSLLITQLIALVRETFQIDISLREVLVHGLTVVGLASMVENALFEQAQAEGLEELLGNLDALSDEEIKALLGST